jgi:hypothetical protein
MKQNWMLYWKWGSTGYRDVNSQGNWRLLPDHCKNLAVGAAFLAAIAPGDGAPDMD